MPRPAVCGVSASPSGAVPVLAAPFWSLQRSNSWLGERRPLSSSCPSTHAQNRKRTLCISTDNRLTLIGFTGGDAESKPGNNGSTLTVFSVATKRSWKNAESEWESRTEWHGCLAFGKLGDFAAGLKKGAHVQVEGELRSREYDQDGVKHKVFECRLESILKLDRAARRGEPDAGDDPGA